MRSAIFVCVSAAITAYDPRCLITTLSREPFLAEQSDSCFGTCAERSGKEELREPS
jgi:hypothetical protein